MGFVNEEPIDHATEPKKLDGARIEVNADLQAAVINALAAMVEDTAQQNGFWEDLDDAVWLRRRIGDVESTEFTNDVGTIITVGEAERIYKFAGRIQSVILNSKMMLMVSEFSEACESLRETGVDHLQDGNVAEEFADVIIRLLDSASKFKMAIGDEVVQKAERNTKRSYKHGKHF